MSKAIVSNVLSPNMAAQVWTVTYTPVFPFTPASFAVGAVLPPVLYMFRWGHRRGRGKFAQTFSGDGLKKPTIESVAARLAQSTRVDGFANDTEKAMLGDLLLAYVLENKRREVGRDKQVQRIFPAHYFASWIDLPESVAHLRGVPEMIVALLVNQEGGVHTVLFAITRSEVELGKGHWGMWCGKTCAEGSPFMLLNYEKRAR